MRWQATVNRVKFYGIEPHPAIFLILWIMTPAQFLTFKNLMLVMAFVMAVVSLIAERFGLDMRELIYWVRFQLVFSARRRARGVRWDYHTRALESLWRS